MYNRRVPKAHARVEAYGAVDELNTALGMARAVATDEWLRSELQASQQDLVVIMGELATDPLDAERYVKDGYPVFKAEMLSRLDELVRKIESEKISFKGWATPGASPGSATLDVARASCRRAERRLWALRDRGELSKTDLMVYLNRLSDVLWLMARRVETQLGVAD